ncbi:hypothetical protein [Achromobacter anxifer]
MDSAADPFFTGSSGLAHASRNVEQTTKINTQTNVIAIVGAGEPTAANDKFEKVPELADVRLAAGEPIENHAEEQAGMVQFHRSFLKAVGADNGKARVVYAQGDSIANTAPRLLHTQPDACRSNRPAANWQCRLAHSHRVGGDMKCVKLSLIFALACPLVALAQGVTAPVDITADTGSHTCTSQGQDHKNYRTAYAGDDRYFVDMKLTPVSIFGKGTCEYSPDHKPAIEEKVFYVTDADGKPECQPRPVRATIRAYADCTNDLRKIGSRVAAECRFTATTKRGKPQ